MSAAVPVLVAGARTAAPRGPCWSQPRRRRDQIGEGGWWKCPSQGLERDLRLLRPEPDLCANRFATRLMRQRKLPAGSRTKLDDLLAKAQRAGATGRQIDRPDRNLRREASGEQ
jgi:hypothetical protein